ncbi:MAG: fibronectin type III domain-containing protein [Candidatus Saccharimonadales bacterium]
MNIIKRLTTIVKPAILFATAMLAVAALLLSQGAQAATPAFVQVKAQKISSGTENSQAITNTAGNLMVVYVLWENNQGVTLTDSSSNTYTPVAPVTRFNNNQWSSQVFYAKNVAGGSNTVTATFAKSTSEWAMVYAHEYSGMDKVNPLDSFVTTVGTSGTMSSGTLTTTKSNDLLFATGAANGCVTGAGSGFTTRSTLSCDRTMDRVAGAAGQYSTTASHYGNPWVMHLVAFKADTGDTQAPSVPTGLQAAGSSETQIDLSWTASTDNVGVTGYKIYREGVHVANSATTSYSDGGLSPDTTYAYTVSAYDAADNHSAQSASVNGTTLADTTAPSVPLNLVASAVSDTQINLSWDASSDNIGVTGYKVYRDGVEVGSASSNAYQDTGLNAETTYSYTIKAFDAAGNLSAESAPATATTQAPPDTAPPSVPANVVATAASSTTVDLTWDASSDNVGVAGYKVLRDGVEIANIAATTHQDTGLTPGATYSYTVSAYDAAGNNSAQSAAASVTMPVPPDDESPQVALTEPTDGAVVRGTVSLKATATDNVAVNRIEFLADGQLLGSDTTSPYELALDTTTLTNNSHTITATAFDASDNSASAQIAINVDNEAPGAPTGLSATAVSHSQINLAWTASTGDVDHYKIFRGGTQVASLSTTSYSDTGLSAETTYNYAVKAYDAVDNESPEALASATTSAEPDTTPPVASNGQPTGTLASGTTTATLSLSTNENATCRYATVAGTAYEAMLPSSFSNTGGTNHSAELSGLADGQSYSYFVRCQDAAGNTNIADYTISFSVASPPPSGDVAFPLSASSNGRYLEDQNGTPFLIMGDSPQGIVASLLPADVEYYLDNRKGHDFNALWINLLSRTQTGGPHSGAAATGALPFTGYLSGNTGNPEYYDLTTPNQAYFDHAKLIIREAAERGMLVVLDPIETMDHMNILRRNGNTRAHAYGQYLGTQFSEVNNIIWMHGNDFNDYMNDTDRTLVRMVGEGIRNTDAVDAMQTVLGFASPSEALDLVFDPNPDDTAWAPLINISTVYTYGGANGYTVNEYNRASSYNDGSYNRGAIPVYLAETFYDFEEDAIDFRPNRKILEFRCQQYSAMLGGATGHTYGSYRTVNLDAGWNTANSLDTPAVANFKRLVDLFESYAWHNLVPQNSMIVAGGGEVSCGAPYGESGGINTGVSAASTADGSLAIAYLPSARTVTLNTSLMNGAFTARWFDPTTGTYTNAACTPSGSNCQFTPPGTTHVETSPLYNRDGQNQETSTDWVLVLQAGEPDTEAPSVPTGLQAATQSSSQIDLSWTASTDNIGVSGYKVYRDGVQVATASGTSYQDTGLTPETAYSYTVSAHDGAGNNSAQTAPAGATTLAPPSPDTTPPSIPAGLSAQAVSASQIDLSWTASTDDGGSGVKNYRVFSSTDNITFTLAGSPTTTSFSHTALSAGTTYYYYVQTEDNAGNVSASSATVSATTQTPPPVSEFLMAAWGFNEGSGTAASDASPNGNTATITGTNPWGTGKYGTGLSFSGTTHLSVPNSASTNISGSELTLSMWLNPQQGSSTDSILLGKFWHPSTWTDPYYQFGFELWGGNEPVFQIGTSGGVQGVLMGSTIPLNQWTHLAVTFSGSQVKFYVNGNLVSTKTLNATISARGNAMFIGADQSVGQHFKGTMDDIRIYNKALSQAEIQADMNTSL